MAERSHPDAGLAALERRSRDRWIVTTVVVVGVVAAAVLLLAFDDATAQLRPWVAAGLGVVTVLYVTSAVLDERRRRRTVRALVEERGRSEALSARVRALETLQDAARGMTAAEGLPEVFARLVEGAIHLAGARAGSVCLRVGDRLTVAASAGPGSPQRGEQVEPGAGPAWAAVDRDEVVVDRSGAEVGAGAGAVRVAAPLRLPHRVVGALVVDRAPESPPLTDADRAAVALFAEHAALALQTATRRERDTELIEQLQDDADRRAWEAAGVVHDLRAPIAAVTGYAQLLRERDEALGPERRRAIAGDLLAELERAGRMLDDLLRCYAVERGEALDREPVAVSEVLEHAAGVGRGLSQRHGKSREVTTTAPAKLMVDGDQDALTRVVVNLVENAVRHTPPGTPIELSAAPEGDHIVIRVRDHGPGVDATDCAGLGGPDAAGRNAGSAALGSGLGLLVAHTLVEAHGGELELCPAAGGGTLAELRLPRDAAATGR